MGMILLHKILKYCLGLSVILTKGRFNVNGSADENSPISQSIQERAAIQGIFPTIFAIQPRKALRFPPSLCYTVGRG
nr:hypothetical protein [Clostridia bacterium]